MRILSVKPGHDGAVAFVDDGRLVFSLESEKDSFPRRGAVSGELMMDALERAPAAPDVLALGGWHKHLPGHVSSRIGAGYLGLDALDMRDGRLLGRPVKVFTSSHERSHLFMATALAPAAPLEECAIVVWEGVIGAIYHWREHGRRIDRTEVLTEPGARYGAMFALADPTFPDSGADPRDEDAGKLMALAAYDDGEPPGPEVRETVEALLRLPTLYPFDKRAFRGTPLHDCGVESAQLARAAAAVTGRLYSAFESMARRVLPPGLPLLVSGGCALNCDWNRRWAECDWFDSVEVAPCANDSGSAIGTAVDAMTALGSPCKLEWSVYSGAEFRWDAPPDPARWRSERARPQAVAAALSDGAVVAWVQGRCEIGPRALGNRSLLASPLWADMRDRLNEIKYREHYRPIAPVCLEEELDTWFEAARPDPYMLYFSRVTTERLPAVTHVDGTARAQSVGARDAPALRELLLAVRDRTGVGVLCNTSLNFKGAGFINSSRELFAYADARGLDDVVVGDTWYRRIP